MRKKCLWMLAAILSCGLALTSCSEADNPVPPSADPKSLTGEWVVQYDATGSFQSIDSNGKTVSHDYTRIVEVYDFEADMGVWNRYFFNDESSDPVGDLGGGSGGSQGRFSYHTYADGTIGVKLDNTEQIVLNPIANFEPLNRTLHLLNGKLTAKDINGKDIVLTKDDGAWGALIEQWNILLHGGAAADNENINDKEINAANWRTQQAIYLYDGVGKDAKDSNGREGYTLVNLPWNKGVVQTNLPNGFCDDITPENGWELALNYCGSRSVVNNNFFALYNKYSGILRFFYYMPEKFSAGNDHVWQVAMTDALGCMSTWRYGIPMDRTITNKAALNQTGNGTMMDYVTPWVDYKSNDGLIVPNAGWWAFDVDLSVYRAPLDKNKENIKLQMRSWNTSHVSLTSTIKAQINTPLPSTGAVSASKGISTNLEDYKKVGTDLVTTIKNIVKSDYMGAIKDGFNFCKGAWNLLAGSADTKTDKASGAINLNMNGTIDTEGTIKGSMPTVGVASPTFSLSSFDTANSHVGQGVWNIKSSPVVYTLPYHISRDDTSDDYYVYFFDPSSIDVVLNPAVFPDDQVEWTQVDATCIQRGVEVRGHAATFCSALGMGSKPAKGSRKSIWGKIYPHMDGLNGVIHWTDDFLYNAREDRNGLVNGLKCRYAGDSYGRGTETFTIEPLVTELGKLEVNVTVTVKLRGMSSPLVYNRSYVPEYKSASTLAEQEKIYAAIKSKDLGKQKNRDLYDHQTRRIFGLCKWGDYNFGGKMVKLGGSQPEVEKLFDNVLWSYDDPTNFKEFSKYVWTPEISLYGTNPAGANFEFEKPVRVVGYELYAVPCVKGSAFFPFYLQIKQEPLEKYTPSAWMIKARQTPDEFWTDLDNKWDFCMFNGVENMFCYNHAYSFKDDVRSKLWKYFSVDFARAWINEGSDACKVCIPEFRLVYYGDF